VPRAVLIVLDVVVHAFTDGRDDAMSIPDCRD